MTYRTIRQRLLLSAGSTVIMGLFLAAAANSQASATDTNRTYTTANDASMDDGNQKNANRFQPTALHHHFWEALVLEPQDAWSSLRSSFQWQEKKLPADAQARVDEWIEYYRSSPHNIAAITERATPWLAWIAQQVSDRGLPGEIALIPFVESSF